jgi:Flp pilus assembly protein TadD
VTPSRIEALRGMLERHPDDPRLRFGLALEHLGAGDLEAGIAELRHYLSLADDEGNAWGRLGAALAELGRLDEAREAYRTGIEAARAHGHPTLAEELESALEAL